MLSENIQPSIESQNITNLLRRLVAYQPTVTQGLIFVSLAERMVQSAFLEGTVEGHARYCVFIPLKA